MRLAFRDVCRSNQSCRWKGYSALRQSSRCIHVGRGCHNCPSVKLWRGTVLDLDKMLNCQTSKDNWEDETNFLDQFDRAGERNRTATEDLLLEASDLSLRRDGEIYAPRYVDEGRTDSSASSSILQLSRSVSWRRRPWEACATATASKPYCLPKMSHALRTPGVESMSVLCTM